MKAKFKKLSGWLLAVIVIVVLVALLGPGITGNPVAQAGPPVGPTLLPVPPSLTADWWIWALGIETANNPLADTTGEKCDVGQPDSDVFFLAGTLGGTVTRSCTVPAGKKLLIPVINAEMSIIEEENGLGCGFDNNDNGLDEQDLRDCTTFLMDSVTKTKLRVDNFNLDKEISRVQSESFTFGLPADNILGIAPAPVSSDAVADGFFVLLDPLPVGQHDIKFEGMAKFDKDPGINVFKIKVTYHITVE